MTKSCDEIQITSSLQDWSLEVQFDFPCEESFWERDISRPPGTMLQTFRRGQWIMTLF